MGKTENFILEATFRFSLNIIKYCELLESKRKFIVAKQLFKAGTSIGANVREAQFPESRADFIHKMKIALKEASESEYWLEICQVMETYPDCQSLLDELDSIKNVLCKITISSRK
jgi:four helix bundle protein